MTAVKSEDALARQVTLMAKSYERLLGKPLLPSFPTPTVDQLWAADFALLSHGTEEDPIFNYANQLALTLFERSFEEFTKLPSRLSSKRVVDEDRIRLLERVTQQGYIDNYTGIRVSASGRLFEINDAVVWNLHDDDGDYRGQAAKISAWHYVD